MARPRANTLAALAPIAALAIGLATAHRLAAAPARSADAIMKVGDVKPGMKGYAVTVFEGQESDRFQIEVVDVIKNYLPKQDAVLFRSTDPRLEHSGIVGGMSGSPIYVEGKLVGALSYGWRFNKDPLGALTPIGNMQEVGSLPFRPDVLPRPKSGQARKGAKAWADAMLGLKSDPLPPRRRPSDDDPTEGLEPLSIPFSVSGLSAGPTRMLADAFGLVPVRGGSGGDETETAAKSKPRKWKAGDAVSVVLVRGDSSVAGNGTVTWVGPKGDRLLAFGHSMFNDGPTNVPMADARVHAIIASVERSVKLSSPLTIQGLMYQDRQAAIALRTDLRAPMIPMHTTMRGPDPDLPARTYDNKVAVGVSITPNLAAVVLAEAVDEAGRDATEVVVKIEHDLSFQTSTGPEELHIEEEVFFPQGVVGRMMGQSRGVAALAAALDNPYEVAEVRKIQNSVSIEYGTPLDAIQVVRLRESEVRAGDVVRLEVGFKSYKGDERTEIIPVRIPDDAGDEEIVIEVTGGDYVRPYRPMPNDLHDLLETIETSYPSRSLIISIYREHEGLSTRHGLLRELPDSVLETLSDQSSTQDAVRFKQLARRVIPTKTIIEGQHTIKLDVMAKKTSE